MIPNVEIFRDFTGDQLWQFWIQWLYFSEFSPCFRWIRPKCWGPTIPPQSSLVWLNQIASHVLCWGLWQRFRMKKPVIWFRFQMFWALVEGFGILPKKYGLQSKKRLLEGPAGNFRISSEIVHWLQWPWNNRLDFSSIQDFSQWNWKGICCPKSRDFFSLKKKLGFWVNQIITVFCFI